MPARRAHKKSRLGCTECKRRKIKVGSLSSSKLKSSKPLPALNYPPLVSHRPRMLRVSNQTRLTCLPCLVRRSSPNMLELHAVWSPLQLRPCEPCPPRRRVSGWRQPRIRGHINSWHHRLAFKPDSLVRSSGIHNTLHIDKTKRPTRKRTCFAGGERIQP